MKRARFILILIIPLLAATFCFNFRDSASFINSADQRLILIREYSDGSIKKYSLEKQGNIIFTDELVNEDLLKVTILSAKNSRKRELTRLELLDMLKDGSGSFVIYSDLEIKIQGR